MNLNVCLGSLSSDALTAIETVKELLNMKDDAPAAISAAAEADMGDLADSLDGEEDNADAENAEADAEEAAPVTPAIRRRGKCHICVRNLVGSPDRDRLRGNLNKKIKWWCESCGRRACCQHRLQARKICVACDDAQ